VVKIPANRRDEWNYVFDEQFKSQRLTVPSWERCRPGGEWMGKCFVAKHAGETPALPGCCVTRPQKNCLNFRVFRHGVLRDFQAGHARAVHLLDAQFAGARCVAPRVSGFLKRKNKFPTGGVMVMLVVPLLVLSDLQAQHHRRHGLVTR